MMNFSLFLNYTFIPHLFYIMKKSLPKKALTLSAMLGLCMGSAFAIEGDGTYFVQTFEDAATCPASSDDSATELAINVPGQGEWLYLKAFQASNTSYIVDGSAHNLRLPKSGSYVISPVLANGVNKVTFDIGRASVTVYVSSDEGATWTTATQSTSGKQVTVSVGSESVNRIKIANDSSKDADIDNITIYAQTFETPVKLATAAAADITTSSALLSGSITETGGETVTEVGFVWSSTSKEPTLSDNVLTAPAVADAFSATLEGLNEGQTVYYRAYARYGTTFCYSTIKSFKTEVSDDSQKVDSLGRYFVQDFEDAETFPQTQPKTEQSIYVKGQGEWLFLNAYKSTNSSYNLNGSTMNLRMPKNGSYVITPVLNSGVKKFSWDQMRKTCVAYVSSDGGDTWTQVTATSDGNARTVEVGSLTVNRIKIINEANSDADIDNLIVYAEAFGTPAILTTGSATNITKNTAEVSGTVFDAGDQPITQSGIIWSASNPQPSLADNVVTTEEPASATKPEITVLLTGLKASQTIYYRAFALSNAGYAFGEVKSFETAQATAAIVVTSDVTKSGSKFRIGGLVTDDGGLDLVETGVIYSKTPGLSYESETRVAMSTPSYKFSTSVALDNGATYYVRAYAKTALGIAYGEEKTVVTEAVQDTPDVIAGDIIWCAPDGVDATADGSEQNPFFDVQKAIDLAQPGDRIYMKAGTYVYDKRINIDDHNGTAELPIELFGYNGRAVLDFSGMPYHAHSNNPYQGIRLTSSYWHFRHIDICNASDNGMLIERNKPTGGSSSDVANRTQDAHDNLIEECDFYKNGDTGLQIKNLGSNNRIINCDSYLNCDEDQGDADGFAPKISVGDNNYFYGCRAYLNSDDGWDVFFKKDGGFGDNMTIIMENCVSYKNGFLNETTIAESGNGNGFKCGSNQGAMNVYLNRCLAIHNKAKGFDQNHNAGDIIMNNCTGMTLKSLCGDKTYSYRIYEDIASGHEVRLTNCIAINDNDATDKRDKTGAVKSSEHGKYGLYGRFEIDETLSGLTITTCEFQKADPTQFVSITNDAELIAPRNADGSLPETTFAHLVQGSFLIEAGTPVAATTYRGIEVAGIEYLGDAPDLGAYEFEGEVTPINLVSQESANGAVRLIQCGNGMILIALDGPTGLANYRAVLVDASGRLLGHHRFNGRTTAIRLPQTAQSVVVLTVDGDNGFHGTVKAIVR